MHKRSIDASACVRVNGENGRIEGHHRRRGKLVPRQHTVCSLSQASSSSDEHEGDANAAAGGGAGGYPSETVVEGFLAIDLLAPGRRRVVVVAHGQQFESSEVMYLNAPITAAQRDEVALLMMANDG